MEIRNYDRQTIVARLDRCGGAATSGHWTGEAAPLVQYRLQFAFDGQMPESGVDALTTSDTVLVVLVATLRRRHEVLNARFACWNRLPTKEAAVTLQEEETFQLLHAVNSASRSRLLARRRRRPTDAAAIERARLTARLGMDDRDEKRQRTSGEQNDYSRQPVCRASCERLERPVGRPIGSRHQ